MKILKLLPVLVLLLICTLSYSQDIDLNLINNIDQVSDADLSKYMARAKSQGLSDEQLISIAESRGVSPDQIEKFKARIAKLEKATTTELAGSEKKLTEKDRKKDKLEKPDSTYNKYMPDLKIFGASLFYNTNIVFEPNLRIPTPKNYVVGPDDELLIDIFGYSQASFKPTVSPEGNIMINGIGMIGVSGLTIDQVSAKIKAKLANIYSGLNTGETNVSVSLGNIRSIKVTLIGAIVKPGTYTIPSLSTLFNALYVSGGPSKNGSFRNIELIRNNKTVAVLDLYDFLLKGDQSKNMQLNDQDVIKVNAYDVRVELKGAVKEEKIFEVKPKESLKDVLGFAGGFKDDAFKENVKVVGRSNKQLKIFTVDKADFGTFYPTGGEVITVDKIAKTFENRVSVTGAVQRPGDYELKDGYTLKKLILDASGLKPEAFVDRAMLRRQKDNLELEVITVNIGKLMSGEDADIALKKNDSLSVESIFNMREKYTVSISGLVNEPKDYPYAENMHIEDLILKAGGFREAGSNLRVEVSRRFRDPNPINPSGQKAEIFVFDVDRNLVSNAQTKDFVLMPFDIVYVRVSPGYEVQDQVKISGEVVFPGEYVIKDKSERISDLVKRANGLTAQAYPEGAKLIRKLPFTQQEIEARNKFLNKFKSTFGDTLVKDTLIFEDNLVGLDLKKILKRPGSKYDLLLQLGDEVRVPIKLETVEAVGAVVFPLSVRYQKGKALRYYVKNAGGFADNALKRKTFVLYSNGKASKTTTVLFFKFYPKVRPGAQIIVPNKPADKKNTAAENIAIASGIGSITLVIVSLINLLK